MPVYKGENGKYYASFYYMRWDGKRVRKKKEGFKTKKEAMLYERDFLLDQEGKTELTFDKLLEKYLEDSKARVKPTTYENNEFIINFISFGKIELRNNLSIYNRLLQNNIYQKY